VFDLPQIYQKPSAKELRDALALLAVNDSFGSTSTEGSSCAVDSTGVPKYLTTIIGSALTWLPEDDIEDIWELASTRLTERSGRTAMASLTRTLDVPLSTSFSVPIVLHEPALTEDNLGLKTWSSSYVLAQLLSELSPSLPIARAPLILELGAGTGLVGLAAACTWSASVVLTDLPEIEANLAGNITLNTGVLLEHAGTASSGVLDWASPYDLRLRSGDVLDPELTQAGIILAADSIYSPQHVSLLTNTIGVWLERTSDAAVLLAHPQREGYEDHFVDLRRAMGSLGLRVTEEGLRTTRDDWEKEVKVVWMVWKWSEEYVQSQAERAPDRTTKGI